MIFYNASSLCCLKCSSTHRVSFEPNLLMPMLLIISALLLTKVFYFPITFFYRLDTGNSKSGISVRIKHGINNHQFKCLFEFELLSRSFFDLVLTTDQSLCTLNMFSCLFSYLPVYTLHYYQKNSISISKISKNVYNTRETMVLI